MERLIEELLLLAREDYQQLPVEVIDCNKLLNEICDELKLAFSYSPVKITVIHQEQWSLEAPLSVLKVVLTNIATNAMRYTKEGEVILTTYQNFFEVKDTGEGFDPEFLKHAFQPFSRAHHENTKGFGLGLSIAKRFCDSYKWRIHLDSAPGEGSTFQIHT